MRRGTPLDEIAEEDAYYAEIGKRLLDVRKQRGLVLQSVQYESGGRWHPAVIGSYERAGHRDEDGASKGRKPGLFTLYKLSRFYEVPLDVLIPGLEGPEVPLDALLAALHHAGEVRAACEALDKACGPLRAALSDEADR